MMRAILSVTSHLSFCFGSEYINCCALLSESDVAKWINNHFDDVFTIMLSLLLLCFSIRGHIATALSVSCLSRVSHTVVLTRSSAITLKQGVSSAFLCSQVTFHRHSDLHLSLSPPKPTSDDPANLLRTPNKLQHVTVARTYDARPHCRLISPF